jgi:hypothetical protein
MQALKRILFQEREHNPRCLPRALPQRKRRTKKRFEEKESQFSDEPAKPAWRDGEEVRMREEG